jgi:hypothetical protein
MSDALPCPECAGTGRLSDPDSGTDWPCGMCDEFGVLPCAFCGMPGTHFDDREQEQSCDQCAEMES